MEKVKESLIDVIKFLAGKANEAHDSNDALKFTQSALNAAHTIQVLANIDKDAE